jgi:hypothetical protein
VAVQVNIFQHDGAIKIKQAETPAKTTSTKPDENAGERPPVAVARAIHQA